MINFNIPVRRLIYRMYGTRGDTSAAAYASFLVYCHYSGYLLRCNTLPPQDHYHRLELLAGCRYVYDHFPRAIGDRRIQNVEGYACFENRVREGRGVSVLVSVG